MKFLTFATLFLFISCTTEFDGTFEVAKDMTFKLKKKNLTLVEGSYDAEIKAKRKKLYLVVTVDGQEEKIKFKMPKDSEFPRWYGEFKLQSSQSGQNYDLEASVNTDTSRSRSRRGSETCTYQVRRTRCYTDNRGRRVCEDYYDTVYGRRNIEYYYQYNLTRVAMSVFDAETNDRTAEFKADKGTTDKVIEYRGPCRYIEKFES